MIHASKTKSAYRHLAIALFTVMCLITVGREIFKEIFDQHYIGKFVLVFAPTMVLTYVLALRVLYVLRITRSVFYALIVMINIAILIRLATVLFSGFFREEYFFILLISPIMYFLSLIVVVYFICIDLFSDHSMLSEKLWASVCVYFLIGVSFGSLYSTVILINPMALGIPINHALEVYILGIIHSINIISGLDPLFDGATESVKMIAVLESSIATLYLVILIGRLLGMPGASQRQN